MRGRSRVTGLVVLVACAALVSWAVASTSAPARSSRAGHALAEAHRAGGPDRKAQRPKGKPRPQRLWRLYPLNPRANDSRAATRAPTPRATPRHGAPTPRVTEPGDAPGAAEARDSARRAAGSDAGSTPALDPWIYVVGVAAALMAALGAAAAWRRARPAVPGGKAGAAEDTMGSKSDSPLASPEEASVVHREHVRVLLVNGRTIEGWQRGAAAHDSRVIVLDVEAAYDSSGQPSVTTPLDSFLLPGQIERVEPLEPASGGPD